MDKLCNLRIRDQNITVECAYTEQMRVQGLMYRTELPENSGMLFIYPEECSPGFCMTNTNIPLSIAFIRSDGTIAEIKSMQPRSSEVVAPTPPIKFKYALEMNQSWFDRNNIKPGDQVTIPQVIRDIQAEPLGGWGFQGM